MAASSASSSWLVHVKTFVDPDLPASHQIASRDAIADLINHKALSLLQIVAEMEDYLTSSNGAVRARGILLLGELWKLLLEQPLEGTIIHTFAMFFSARLEDWHSLHGALVGCLALVKRKKNVGLIPEEDAKALVESALNNLEVQALAQQDRMLCLELFESLLLHHSGAVTYHGALFANRICEIIEGEKDPRCLLLVFHIVEVAVELFPDPTGHIGRISEDLFGIISCYFPISFNPAPDDKRGITSEDLSVALMRCFASTNLFADLCIPLLLEKLSSTLKGAKRDSLKFLSFCVTQYSSEALQDHADAIWMALKKELIFLQGTDNINLKEKDDQVLADAQDCFQACIRAFHAGNQDDIEVVETNSFLQSMLQDAFWDDFITCLPSSLVHIEQDTVSSTGMGVAGGASNTSVVLERAEATIRETGSILATAVKASPFSCFAILRTLLRRMFETMKIGVDIQEADILNFLEGPPLECTLCFPGSLMVPVMEVVYSTVEGAREVAEHFCKTLAESNTQKTDFKWMNPLQSYSGLIVMSFASAIVSSLQIDGIRKSSLAEKLWEVGVAGLQAVGSFPPEVSAISDSQYNFVVSFFKCIIVKRSEVRPLWSRTVHAIAGIGSAEEKYLVEGQRRGVIDTFVSLLLNELLDNGKNLSVQCNMEALAIICRGRPQPLIVAVRKLTGMVCDEMKKCRTGAEENTSQIAVPLLQGFLHSILTSCGSSTPENDAVMELVVAMWGVVESLPTYENLEDMEELSASYVAHSLQMLECSLGIFQVSISKCEVHSQRNILLKMLDRFLDAASNITLHISIQDVWIIGLFASVLTVLQPSVQIPREDEVLQRLLAAAVSPSCSSVNNVASEAVGYLLNKWHADNDKLNVTNGVNSAITTAIDLVLKGEWVPKILDRESGACDAHTGKETLLLKKKCIHLLACIGKGLAMRGHIAVSDIAMLLLKFVECKRLFTDMHSHILLEKLWPKDEEMSAVSFAAAEALGFISKDLKAAVTKQSHLIVKPLYQQRFFVCMLPPLVLALKEADTQGRVMLYCAFGNLVSDIPTNVILTESRKVLPLVLESLSTLSGDQRYSNVLLSVLLVLSAILVDRNAGEFSAQHVPAIVNRLLTLLSYPYSSTVRETCLLCLGTLVALPYARVFPFRSQVLKSLINALDDPKRAVRKEAVRCRRAWDSIAR